jgi:hypothetical protein
VLYLIERLVDEHALVLYDPQDDKVYLPLG